MRVKICGITDVNQGIAIVHLGATALGFICFPASPRYIQPHKIREIVEQLPMKGDRPCDSIGVFVNATIPEIQAIVETAHLTGVQLHGSESPEFCQALRSVLPQIEILKAFRVKEATVLDQINTYGNHIDTLLLDAYHPAQLGGTGLTLNWLQLQSFQPTHPWFLAGGLTPDNIQTALSQVCPDGIDLSSGVEKAPGQKDLEKVAVLFEKLT